MFGRDFFGAALMCPAVLNQYLIKLNEVCLWWNLEQIQNRFMCQWLSLNTDVPTNMGLVYAVKNPHFMVFSSPDSYFLFHSYILLLFLLITHLYLFIGPPPPPLSSPPSGSPVCRTDADRATDNVAQCLLFVNDSAATVCIHWAWVRVLVSTCRLDSLHVWAAVYGHPDSVCSCHYHTANTHKHTQKLHVPFTA